MLEIQAVQEDVETSPGVITRLETGINWDENDPTRKTWIRYGIAFYVPDWNEDRLVRWAVSQGADLAQAYATVGINSLLPPAAAIPCVLAVYQAGTSGGNWTCVGIRDCFAKYIREAGLFRLPEAGPPPEGWVDPQAPGPVEPGDLQLILRCLEARYGYSEATSRGFQRSVMAKYPGGVTGPVEQMALLSQEEQAFARAGIDCEANPEIQPPTDEWQPPTHHHQPHGAAPGGGAAIALVVAAGLLVILSR